MPESSPSDQERILISRIVAGDIDAYGEIVERWQGPLINLAYGFCQDSGRAEDMAQEAFIKAFTALSSWRGEGVFSTWLFAI